MMDVPHYWTADQVQLLLAVLAEKNRHQARTAAWRTFRSGGRVGCLMVMGARQWPSRALLCGGRIA